MSVTECEGVSVTEWGCECESGGVSVRVGV